MRILNRKEFLALNGEHVFAKYKPAWCKALAIKIARGPNDVGRDFAFQDLDPLGMLEVDRDVDMLNKTDAMERDSSVELPIDLDCCGRDGFFDDDQLFIVLSRHDVAILIDRLKKVLESS